MKRVPLLLVILLAVSLQAQVLNKEVIPIKVSPYGDNFVIVDFEVKFKVKTPPLPKGYQEFFVTINIQGLDHEGKIVREEDFAPDDLRNDEQNLDGSQSVNTRSMQTGICLSADKLPKIKTWNAKITGWARLENGYLKVIE